MIRLRRIDLFVIASVFLLALCVRGLTAYFVGTHLDDQSWFPFGIYNIFHSRANAILSGEDPLFWIADPSQTNAAIYPPGYPLCLAIVYGVSGIRSHSVVQVIQLVLDSFAVLLIASI